MSVLMYIHSYIFTIDLQSHLKKGCEIDSKTTTLHLSLMLKNVDAKTITDRKSKNGKRPQ